MDVLNRNILSNPILSEWIQKMEKRTGALNLIRSDWKEVLENSELYKKHKTFGVKYTAPRLICEKTYLENVIGPNNCFDVLVAGHFSLSLKHVDTENPDKIHQTTIVMRTCQPIFEISSVMAANHTWVMQNNCKFFVEKCNPNICSKCYNYRSMLRGPDDDWCIINTRFFDGVSVQNVFKSNIEYTFGQLSSFVGIMRITVNSRMHFPTGAKVGGSVKEFIIFKESALIDEEDVFVNPSLEVDAPLPSIGFPPSPSTTPTIEEKFDNDNREELQMALPHTLIRKRG